MLVSRDESDSAQALLLAPLSPEERLLRHQRVLAQLRELRQAGKRARAGS